MAPSLNILLETFSWNPASPLGVMDPLQHDIHIICMARGCPIQNPPCANWSYNFNYWLNHAHRASFSTLDRFYFLYKKGVGGRSERGMEAVFSVGFRCALCGILLLFLNFHRRPSVPRYSYPTCPHVCMYPAYLETSHSRRFNYSECRISRSSVDFVMAKIVTRSVNWIQTNSPHMSSLKYWDNAYFKTRTCYELSTKEN